MMRRACMWGLLTLSGIALGCTCHLTSDPDVNEDVCEACAAIAVDSRSHVYIFFLKGGDVLDCAGMTALKDTIASLGFGNAWCGHNCHLKAFKKEIGSILHDDPKAHFVLVGHGHGLKGAVELAEVIGSKRSQVHLLVSLGERVNCPDCVLRQLTLVPRDCGSNDQDICELKCKKTSKLPADREGTEILARELFALAGGIPSECDLPKMYYPEKEPTPRPVMPSASVKRDRWDFLRPAPVDERETLPPGTLPTPNRKTPAATSAKISD
jgi:hypothetical protein